MREREPQPPRRPEDETKPAKTPHLHVRSVEGALLAEVVAITGNAKALLKLRSQIGCALKNETFYPFEEGVHQNVNGIEFEVAVKRTRNREGMKVPGPKPEKTAERLSWAEIARGKGHAEGGEATRRNTETHD